MTSRDNPINLKGVSPDPQTFDGPLNLFIELHGTAVAYNTATETRDEYLSHPAAAPDVSPPLPPAPEGTPTPPGVAVTYMRPHIIDVEIARRVKRRPF